MKLDETTKVALVIAGSLFVFLGLPALVQKAASAQPADGTRSDRRRRRFR